MPQDQLREWFGEQRCAQALARVRRFWRGEGRVLATAHSTQHPYRQVYDDQRMLAEAPGHLRAQASLPGISLPSFFADFGTVSTARYWGAPPRFSSVTGNIFVDPVAETLEEAITLDPLPPGHPERDAARAIRLYRRLSESLGTDLLWLRTPDMQGVLNTAGLVVRQEELFIGMHSDPEGVHALLDRVCGFLISYAAWLREQAAGRVCGNIWPYTYLPAELGVSLTEDMMPLLSAETYREFSLPYLRRIAEAFGGVQIHCCGDWGRHAPALAESGIPIRAVEYHHPFTRVEELEPLAGRSVFIPYIALQHQNRFRSEFEYYRHLMANTDERHRYWFALGHDAPEALAFVQECEREGRAS